MSKRTIYTTSLLILTLWSASLYYTFATPPTTPYNVAETLDPTCTPGSTNCYVKIVDANNGLTLSGTNTVQLGGTLLNDTTITTGGREFIVQGTNSKLVSGADPLDLFPLIGEAFPGVGISTDGILTGGVKSYIGSLISPSNNKPLTIVGNFDLANGIQAAMVAEDKEVNIYSSDGVSGSSNISLNSGGLSLGASDGIDIYSTNYLRFNNFNSSRDDSGTNFPTNFLYTDGSGNLQSAPVSLLGGGGAFSLTSQDEGTSLTSATNTYNFTGAGVTATNSGGVVNVNIPGVIGGGDGSIYLNDGTLTGNRVVNGAGNELIFGNNLIFMASASSVDGFDGQTRVAGLFLDPRSTAATDQVALIEGNSTTGLYSAVAVDDTKGIGFAVRQSIGSSSAEYWFPLNDGLANQVLTTNGAGQLSWQNGGGGGTNIYNANGTLTGNRTLDANHHNLFFSNVNQFIVKTEDGIYDPAVLGIIDFGLGHNAFHLQANSLDDHGSFVSSDFGNLIGATDWNDLKFSLLDMNDSSNNGAAVGVESDSGIRFKFKNSGVMSQYYFPRTDGLANQILTTNGAGQLSWQNGGGGSSLGWYAENATAPTTAPVATGAGSIALGDNAQALSNNMFVYGNSAGYNASNAPYSNFLGNYAGYSATNAFYSNFFGNQAGNGATGASGSNFLGPGAGFGATGANNSNFFGQNAGYNATSAFNANFFGQAAGSGATGATLSNFIGRNAGSGATSAFNANFIGANAGDGATGASYGNFIGNYAGYAATGATLSNFIGASTGWGATNASYSSFIGQGAGKDAVNAKNSIFIGQFAGNTDTVDNTVNADDFSILIGKNTSTGGFENSIAIGGSATNTSSNQFMIGSTTRPIDTLILTGSGGNTCVLDVTVASPSCSSDEMLKTNISDLNTDVLAKLLKVRTVTYDWKNYPSKGSQIGFLAQDLGQYFPEVVSTAPNGYKTVSYGGMTPILVQALRELNLKVDVLTLSQTGTAPTSLYDVLKSWLGDTTNGIEVIVAKIFKADRVETKELCVGATCVNEGEFMDMVTRYKSGNNPVVQPQTPSPIQTVTPSTSPIETPTPTTDTTSDVSVPIDTSAPTQP